MEFDFNANTVVETLNDVPADFQGLYVEADGKYKLNSDDPTVGSAVRAVTGLSKALNASRGEARDLKGRVVDLTPLSDYGDSPESIKAGIDNAIAEATKAAKGKVNETTEQAVEAAKKAMQDQFGKETQQYTERIEGLSGQLHGLLVTNEATKALVEAGAVDPELAMPFIQNQVKVVEQDGALAVRVLNESGEERYGGTGNHMTIKELVEELKGTERFQVLFKSEAPTGGGSQPTHRAPSPSNRSKLSSTQKIAAGLAAGQAGRK